MSRSNYNKPFYVDVGTSVAAIRCASNHDVIIEYDHVRCPQVIKLVKDKCDRINREIERHRRFLKLGTRTEYIIKFIAGDMNKYSILSFHKTLDEAQKRLATYKARSVLLDKECKFKIVMLETTESEVGL